MNEARSARQEQERLHIGISRRALLLAVGCGALEACTSHAEQDPLPDKESIVQLPKIADGPFISNGSERLDGAYLTWLLQSAQQETGNRVARVQAVQNSLRLIQNLTTGAYEATTFQIDNGGYYIAAKHSVPANPKKDTVAVVNPYDGTSVFATEFRVHPEADAAIIFAPTGKPLQKTPNVQVRFEDMPNNEELWMVGLVPRQNIYRRIVAGRVDTSVPLRDFQTNDIITRQTASSRRAVRGMIPYGGMSGSPIVNREGIIVGLESGAYPDDVHTVDEYQGAVVTSLAYLQSASYRLSISA